MNKLLMARRREDRNKRSAGGRFTRRSLKSVLSMVALCSVVFVIAACGSGGGDTASGIPTANQASLTATTQATASATADVTPTATNGATPSTANGTTPTVAPGATPGSNARITPTVAPGATPGTSAGATPVPSTPAPSTPTPVPTPTSAPSGGKTVTVWMQTTDSCMQAIPGTSLIVNGPGLSNSVVGPTPGSGLVGLNTYVHGTCPVDRGTCVQTNTGCASVALNIPASGTATYTIAPKGFTGYLGGIVFQPASPYGRNYAYVWCEGGSDCRYGPEVATVQVSASGAVSAITQNVNPDGTKSAPWPSSGAFTGAASDPIMFHFFGASGPNDFTMTCQNDGTHDLRDHMTGTPFWPHCNSGR